MSTVLTYRWLVTTLLFLGMPWMAGYAIANAGYESSLFSITLFVAALASLLFRTTWFIRAIAIALAVGYGFLHADFGNTITYTIVLGLGVFLHWMRILTFGVAKEAVPRTVSDELWDIGTVVTAGLAAFTGLGMQFAADHFFSALVGFSFIVLFAPIAPGRLAVIAYLAQQFTLFVLDVAIALALAAVASGKQLGGMAANEGRKIGAVAYARAKQEYTARMKQLQRRTTA